jgi:hypothetical protein
MYVGIYFTYVICSDTFLLFQKGGEGEKLKNIMFNYYLDDSCEKLKCQN